MRKRVTVDLDALPSTMTDARRLGVNKYYTGKPCKHGHITYRLALAGSCIECHRIYTAAHRKTPSYKHTFNTWYDMIRSSRPEFFLHQSAKQHATWSGVEFSITEDDVRSVWPEDNRCPITLVPFQDLRLRRGKRSGESPSIDRIDPSKGYIPGNIAVISDKANVVKNNITDPDVFRRLADYLERCVCVKG